MWATKLQDPKLLSNLEENCLGNQLPLRRSLYYLPRKSYLQMCTKYCIYWKFFAFIGQFFANISKIMPQINMKPKLFDSPEKNLPGNI